MEKEVIYSTQIKVRYVETDQGGRVYHSNYFVWLDITRTEFFEKHGIIYSELEDEGDYIVIKKVECDYIRPAFYPQVLTININNVKITNVSLQFNYDIIYEDKVIAEAYTKLAFVNSEGKLKRIPKKVNQLLQNYK